MDNQPLPPTPPTAIVSEQTQTVPDTPKPKINLFLILAVIFVLIIGGISFYLGKTSGKKNQIIYPTATPQISPTPTPPYDLQRKADIESVIRPALELYRSDYKIYPDTLKEIIPKYLVQMPIDPIRKSEYRYQVSQTRLDYSLSANMDDGTIYIIHAPGAMQTSVADTINGSVKLEDGRCCAAGKAGTKISIKANFETKSQNGTVTEMRIKTLGVKSPCLKNSDMENIPWEPFSGEKTYSVDVPLNFSSFDINVQYRDEKGNISDVYCADLAIEGSP